MTESARERLRTYSWPGNVRELENCIERAATLAQQDELTVEDLPERLQLLEVVSEPSQKDLRESDVLTLAELERLHIRRVVKLLGGNKTQAAKLLGIDRSTLHRFLGPPSNGRVGE